MSGLSKNQIKSLCSLRQKKYRQSSSYFIIEGVHLCQEAIKASCVIQTCIVSNSFLPSFEAIPDFSNLEQINVPIHSVADRDFKKISETNTPQGIAMVVKKKDHDRHNVIEQKRSHVLILDSLQDPGNVGTILRTAQWFGMDALFLSKNSVDCYNDKVVRSSMGAIFQLPFFENVEIRDLIPLLRDRGYHIRASVPENGISVKNMQKPLKSALVIGSESQGVQENILKRVDEKITILPKGSGDSLNAAIACGIIVYEMKQDA